MNRVGKKKGVVSAPTHARAKAALRESEERYRALVEAAPDVIYVIAADGTLTSLNPAFEEISGWPRANWIGKPFLPLVDPEDLALANETLQQVLGGETPPVHRLRILSRTGDYLFGEFTSTPYVEQGRIVGVLGIARNITKRTRAEEELRASREQLRALTVHLQTVREEERIRIARAVHDELGQELTGLKMDLRWLEHGLEDFRDPRASPLLEKTMAATDLVDTTIKTVQRIAADLRPAVLDKLGLVAAVRREASQFQQHSGIACRLTGPDLDPQLPEPTAIACFRFFQEAMTNVVRHAEATAVEVDFQTPPDGFVLEVRDNGKGISTGLAENAGSLGLLGMRERARALGGELTVEPRAMGGTLVRLWIPKADKR